jgi:TonB-linked SusC/RagA family outer membrane protein
MKNNLYREEYAPTDSNLKHFFRIMKTFCFLITFCISAAFATTAKAQNVKVRLSSNRLTIGQLVKEIEHQTDYLFVYNSDKIDTNQLVQVDARRNTVKNILIDVFGANNIEYKVEGENIVLTKLHSQVDNWSIQQQKKTLTGKVVDIKGEPLIGVSIVEKGTKNGTITDIDGNYSLSLNNDNSIIIASYVGYVTSEVSSVGKQSIRFVLHENNLVLGEVVITGFGLSQKKASLTGAISSIGDKDIERSLATTVSGALVGKIPGINSRQADGRPGASTSIQIRNMGTPLYVIDGSVKDEGQFNNLDQNDIESIAILKDASAAIYGVRAANGVVVVTTKRGHLNTGNSIAVNAYYGWQNLSKFAKPADAKTYLTSYIQSQTVQGVTNYTYSKEDYGKWCQGTEKGYRPFDWYDYIWKTAPQTYINVSSSGGSDKINYYFSMGQLTQNAIIRNYGGFYRTNVQLNIDSKINNKLKVGVSMNGRIEYRVNPGVPGSDDYWLPMFATYRNLPTKRPYANDNPAYPAMVSSEADTNFAILNYKLSGKYQDKWRVIQLNGNAEYDIFRGLKAKWLVGYYLAYEQMNNHEYTYKLYSYDEATDTYPIVFENNNPYRERQVKHVEELTSNVQLSYDRTFGVHHVAGIVGFDASKRDSPYTWLHSIPAANAMNLIDYSTMDEYDDYGNNTEARLGWLGRFNYDYANKYLVELSGRYDGSWKFAPGHRWGFFPSASVGWRISEENFWQNSKVSSFFNNLKIRASYGLVGDDTDETLSSYYSAFDYMEGYNYNNGGSVIDGAWTVGTVARGLPVTTLSWVKAKILDIGMDMSFLNNKLSAQIDYFRRKRTGLPASRYDVLVPNEVGFSIPYENLNSDLRKGFDASVVWKDKYQGFTYSVGANITLARSYNWEQYKPRFSNAWDYYRNSTWHRYSGQYWGYVADGQFQSWDEIAKWSVDIDGQGNETLRPGDIKYKDLNGDGKISGMDQRPIGYATSGTPALNYGFNFSFGWKNFDLSFDLTGAGMMSYMPKYEAQYPFHDGGNNPQYYLSNTWHLKDIWDANSEIISGKYPMPLIGNSSHSNYWNSTFWLINVHYLKLRNFEFGYTIPKELLSKFKISSLRFYVSGSNVFTWTNKPGMDPEGDTNSGLEYPTTRIINTGVTLKF